ncbi:hypothetical protein [Lichenibacterium ramalinae]|uniref:Uncharacterized protein n=1 Tax=Lichenibacterium ramalinae TaxID=2316527 RepID=A0A4Q2RHI5_9HYPH|nr:hypothetical protein [Lichenibacterium ramalinae]RYB06248.1 hypothetical protein D3272_05640 [Lichenibacterium ramalinae]
MAIHAHSTPVPAPQRGLLRATLVAQPWPLAAPENTAAQPCNSSDLAPEEALASIDVAALLPAPLPSLTSAFSRRRAIFGAVVLAAAPVALPAAQAASILSANDRRLVDLADAMWAIHDAAEAHIVEHFERETDKSEAEFSALTSSYSPVEDELAATPAASMQGALAKARACQVPTLRDVDGGPVALSLADDLYRLHAVGRLTHG